MRANQFIGATAFGVILALSAAMQAGGQLFPPIPNTWPPVETKSQRMQTSPIWQATDMIGMEVRGPDQRRLGKIDNFAVDKDTGTIRYAVVSFGGWLGFGVKLLPIPWEALKLVSATKPGASAHYVLNSDKFTLAEAPSFHRGEWPDFDDQKWVSDIRQFYRPYLVTKSSGGSTR